MAENTEQILLRLPKTLDEQVTLIAAIVHESKASIVRQAVSQYIAARVADPEFRAAVRNHITDASLLIGETDA